MALEAAARGSTAQLDAAGSLSGARDQLKALWALPIPDDVVPLPQKATNLEIKTDVWEYGPVAQILHVGPYSEEPATIRRLHDFIDAKGFEIVGLHEEEYLTSPAVKVPKTLIRYRIREKSGEATPACSR